MHDLVIEDARIVDDVWAAQARRAAARWDPATGGPGDGGASSTSIVSRRIATTRHTEPSRLSSPTNAAAVVGRPSATNRNRTGWTGAPASIAAWNAAG